MLILYSSLLYALTPCILLRYYLRSRQNPQYAKRMSERFGFIKPAPKAGGIWVHAVSVGESIAAIKLIKKLQQKYPEQQIIITCATPTGSEIIQNQLGNGVHHVYIPLDFPGAVKRFLRQCQPSVGIIMETELWPNLFHYAHRNDIKLIVSNMRLSEASFKRYQKFSQLTSNTLSKVDLFAVQTQEDAQRVCALGAAKEKVHVVGNLKFEMDASEQIQKYQRAALFPDRKIWIAGSTHIDEDEIVLKAHSALLKEYKNLLLIIVPRHPERFDDVYNLCNAQFKTQRRSEFDGKLTIESNTQVLLIDSIGELSDFIKLSDVCFIGGSLVPVGGHNILEACQAGVPVLFGPHMKNFLQVAQIVNEGGAGLQVKDLPNLIAVANQLLNDDDLCIKMGQSGKALIKINQGALQKTMHLLELKTFF